MAVGTNRGWGFFGHGTQYTAGRHPQFWGSLRVSEGRNRIRLLACRMTAENFAFEIALAEATKVFLVSSGRTL